MRDEEYVLILGTLLFLILTAFILIFIILYRKARLKIVIDQHKFREEILRAEVEIRENTLREVGRDLHDNLGQIASLIRINLAGLAEKASGDRQIGTSLDLMDRLIREMRQLSHALSDNRHLSGGLTGQIEGDIGRLKHLEGLTIHSEISLNPEALDPQREILVYRIFQEALSNALKHADASRIEIHLSDNEKSVSLEVTDNGKGLVRHSDGKGLNHMKARAEIMGGKLHLENANPSGTRLAIVLPKPTTP
jgi:signal transduction histidine kinase